MARTKDKKQELQVVTRDYTLNMHKRLQGIAFKKRATRAVREVRRFAAATMYTPVSIRLPLLSRCVVGCESGHSVEQIPLVKRNQKHSTQGESKNQQKEKRRRGRLLPILQHLPTPWSWVLRQPSDWEEMITRWLSFLQCQWELFIIIQSWPLH